MNLFESFERILLLLEGQKDVAAAEPTGPFARWTELYGLSPLEIDLMVLALLPEADSQFCRTFKEIQPDLDQPRPTVGLGADMLALETHRLDLRRDLLAGPLFRAGFLTISADLPFFDQPLLPGVGLLFGSEDRAPAIVGETYLELTSLDAIANPVVGDEASRLMHWASVIDRPVVVSPGIGTESLAAALSPQGRVLRAWGKLESQALEQAFLLSSALEATLMLEPMSNARLVMPSGARWQIPVLIASEPAEVRGNVAMQRATVPRLTPRQSLELWREELEHSDADLHALAAQTHLSPSQIRRAAAYLRAGTDNSIGAALRMVAGEPRSALANTIEPSASFEDLIVSDDCRVELDRIVQAARLRTEVEIADELPPNLRRLGNIVALFHGDSGTGKTLAAEALAHRLEMPLMVVDVSRVTSKYVGETEQRLDQLFEEAEGFRAVLFLDEADSFFGSRTDISDSNDRYANLETNYLLQRIEQFEGIVVLATNLKKNIDEAFTRRFRFIANFERPTPGQQLAIWRRHLPASSFDEVALTELAQSLSLVGGEIRNIAIAALFDARAKEVPVDMKAITLAARRELKKLGRRIPDSLQ